MTWIVVGLGNPDEEHVRTRHNAGRMAVEYFAKTKKLGEWKEDKKSRSFVVRGAVGRSLAACILPNTYMNKSGNAASHYVKSMKAAEKLIVVYDDLDLPFGTLKISFDRGSGGHKGVDSVLRTVKTRRFTRIRIGISRVDGKGEAQKPQAKTAEGGSPGQRPRGEKEVEKFILGEFSSDEFSQLKDLFKRVSGAIETIILEGREKAMNKYN